MWLVQWMLPFQQVPCMPVDFVLNDRQLPNQCYVEQHQIQLWNQVCQFQPDLWFQSFGKGATLDLRVRLCTMDISVWQKNLRRKLRMM